MSQFLRRIYMEKHLRIRMAHLSHVLPAHHGHRQSSLDTMLTNTKYLGVYRSMGEVIEGGVPQIIDQELFDKVAARTEKLPPVQKRQRPTC